MEEEINRLSTSPNIIQFVLKKDAFWNYNLSKYAKRKEGPACSNLPQKKITFIEC